MTTPKQTELGHWDLHIFKHSPTIISLRVYIGQSR